MAAGQPQGNDKQADNGGNGNGNGYGHQDESTQAPAQAAPVESGGSEKSQAKSHGDGQNRTTRSDKSHTQSKPAAQPQSGASNGGGSNSTATSGPGNSSQGCDGTHHSDTGHGANQGGPYDNTCDGSPSGNGNGNGQATGKPCAGCVGNADDKNPKGQMPGGSDHNAGYECDRNHGIGRSNPAHTGCRSSETPQAEQCPGGDMNGSEAGCGTPPSNEKECPAGAKLDTALTHSAALALKMLAVVHPEFTELSKFADNKAAEKCGGNEGGGNEAEHHNNGNPHEKITICHATGSATNPFVEITISVNGLHGHGKHEDDIIPAPAGGCPTGTTTPPGIASTPPGKSSTPPGDTSTPPATTSTPPAGTTAAPVTETPAPTGETPATVVAPENPGQQAVLGAREEGTSTPATTPAAANEVLGVNAQGTAPAAASAPAAAQKALPADSAGGSLPFTGTDAILVLLLGCVMLLGGLALHRVAARRTS